jgi:hypothetical protein
MHWLSSLLTSMSHLASGTGVESARIVADKAQPNETSSMF